MYARLKLAGIVSIRTRPEGRVNRVGAGHQRHLLAVSIRTRPEGRVNRSAARRPARADFVSIRTRPEGRVNRRVRCCHGYG